MNNKIGLNEYLAGVQKGAGRFPPLLSMSEIFVAKSVRQMLNFVIGPDEKFYASDNPDPFPVEWQLLLHYLYKEGSTSSSGFYVMPSHPEDPPLYFLALFAKPQSIKTDGHKTSPSFSNGASFDMQRAMGTAVGEFLERYALLFYTQSSFFRASAAQIERKKIPHLNPSFLASYSSLQAKLFSQFVHTPESAFYWVAAKKYPEFSLHYVPAQLVFWNYCLHRDSHEPMLREPNSSGAAGMFSPEGAILHGAYELIQRDTFLIYWLNRITPIQIVFDEGLGDLLETALAEIKKVGLRVHVLDITSDISIPCYVAVIIDEHGSGPAVTMGAACGRDHSEAIKKSLEEALSARFWVRTKMGDNVPIGNRDESHLQEFNALNSTVTKLDRALFWAEKESIGKIGFFLSGKIKKFSELKNPAPKELSAKQELEALQQILRSRGPEYEIYFYEADHKILRRLGYHAVRVIIPALIPLSIEEPTPVGGDRLTKVPRILGYQDSESFNPLPHPLL